MKLAIENFAKASGENKILAIGAMAELGDDSIKEHEEVLQEITKHRWKNVLLVGGDFLKTDHPYNKFFNSSEAGEWLKNNRIQNSFLLIKGSRSTQMEKVLDYLEN
jgi:UDP-N-acetylmuramoyl-tripeptide--D-alanyl-D-alanine ligase